MPRRQTGGQVARHGADAIIRPEPYRYTRRDKIWADLEPKTTAMSEAFARALKAREIDVGHVPRIKDADARFIFQEVRWAETHGEPVCPHCHAMRPYAFATRPGLFKCRNPKCVRQFSLTSQTIFASRKTSWQNCLIALGSVHDKDLNATKLAELMRVSYKTALNYAHVIGLGDGRFANSNINDDAAQYYPYNSTCSRSNGSDLIAEILAQLNPRYSPEMKADVSQEVALAVLCGDIRREDIPLAVPHYTRRYNAQWAHQFKDLSLDRYIGSDHGAKFIDNLSGDTMWEMMEQRRYTRTADTRPE